MYLMLVNSIGIALGGWISGEGERYCRVDLIKVQVLCISVAAYLLAQQYYPNMWLYLL